MITVSSFLNHLICCLNRTHFNGWSKRFKKLKFWNLSLSLLAKYYLFFSWILPFFFLFVSFFFLFVFMFSLSLFVFSLSLSIIFSFLEYYCFNYFPSLNIFFLLLVCFSICFCSYLQLCFHCLSVSFLFHILTSRNFHCVSPQKVENGQIILPIANLLIKSRHI
jgi:hypothetical protein